MLMLIFWIVAIIMVLTTLFILFRPLRSGLKQEQNVSNQQQQNIQIAKERLDELKVEREKGSLTEQEYEQTREELELVLLSDIESSATDIKIIDQEKQQLYAKYTLRGVLFIIPIFSVALYFYLGNPDLINNKSAQSASNLPQDHALANGTDQSAAKLPSVDQMIEKLEQRLKVEPDNAEGWFMLGRSYMSMKMYKKAADAFEKTNKLVPDNSVIILRYADALTMLNNGRISGKPFDLVKQALSIKPDEPTGLWLAGIGHEEQGEYQKAISYWNLLLPLLKDQKYISEVQAMINQAKRKAGLDTTESAAKDSVSANSTIDKTPVNSISVNITLDNKYLKNVTAEYTVFIFARAANGPPMPLAVVRKKVKDLPLSVILDDSMAMMPSMKLSSFDKVEVVARISKTGIAKAQSGDFQSAAVNAAAGQKAPVDLIINSIVP